jgi:hypothetical protein
MKPMWMKHLEELDIEVDVRLGHRRMNELVTILNYRANLLFDPALRGRKIPHHLADLIDQSMKH